MICQRSLSAEGCVVGMMLGLLRNVYCFKRFCLRWLMKYFPGKMSETQLKYSCLIIMILCDGITVLPVQGPNRQSRSNCRSFCSSSSCTVSASTTKRCHRKKQLILKTCTNQRSKQCCIYSTKNIDILRHDIM